MERTRSRVKDNIFIDSLNENFLLLVHEIQTAKKIKIGGALT